MILVLQGFRSDKVINSFSMNITKCVLLTFKQSLLVFNQAVTLGSSEFLLEIMSSALGPVRRILVSSAYKTKERTFGDM